MVLVPPSPPLPALVVEFVGQRGILGLVSGGGGGGGGGGGVDDGGIWMFVVAMVEDDTTAPPVGYECETAAGGVELVTADGRR